jgi:hypothetical protein
MSEIIDIMVLAPNLGAIWFLPLIFLAGGAVATTAVAVSNYTDDPTTVNTFEGGAGQTNTSILSGGTGKIILYAALGFGVWYFWKKKKK